MLIALIVWNADSDGNLSQYYRRCIDIWDDTSGLNNQHFPIALIIDGIDTSNTAIVSMSILQPITPMVLSPNDDDTITDASMADP
jgi:hypothetical protein